MSSTLVDRIQVCEDKLFRERMKQALFEVAGDVDLEGESITAHAERKALADQVRSDPDTHVEFFVRRLAKALDLTEVPQDDAVILEGIADMWDTVALA